MNKQVPSKIRSIISNAITEFRSGKVSKTDIEHLLKHTFSDKTFDNILKCSQGDLNVCKKINLEKWKEKANKEVKSIAKKAERKKVVDDSKKKEHAQIKINKKVEEATKNTRAVRRAEKSVLKQANELTEEMVSRPDLIPS